MTTVKVLEKPWGSEEVLELNGKYCMKRLFMKKGHKCSLQYHQLKHETFYIVSGRLLFTYGKDSKSLKEVEMLPGEHYTIPNMMIHRMEGLEDSVYLEASTPELSDVVRLEDSYNRIK